MIPIPELCAVLAAALPGTVCTHATASPPTVSVVDHERYAGWWYEIAHPPDRFRAQCVSDTRATYAQDKDRITVLNECRVADGRVESARDFAHAVGGSGTARLRASFFRPFW